MAEAATEERLALLSARAIVADRYPGCARAILRDDDFNWDRGRLVQDELARIRAAHAGLTGRKQP